MVLLAQLGPQPGLGRPRERLRVRFTPAVCGLRCIHGPTGSRCTPTCAPRNATSVDSGAPGGAAPGGPGFRACECGVVVPREGARVGCGGLEWGGEDPLGCGRQSLPPPVGRESPDVCTFRWGTSGLVRERNPQISSFGVLCLRAQNLQAESAPGDPWCPHVRGWGPALLALVKVEISELWGTWPEFWDPE